MRLMGICAVLLSSTIMLNGCWDYERLGAHALITGIAVDKYKAGHILGIEVMEIPKGTSGKAEQTTKPKVIISSIGIDSVEIPLHSIQTRISGQPFYPNLQILMIGKEQARAGIADIISHFIRDPDMRRTTEAVIAQDKATELLQAKPDESHFTSMYVKDMVTAASSSGRTISSDIGEISRSIHEQSVSLLPVVEPSKDRKEVKVLGTAILNKEKYIDMLNVNESVMIAFLKEDIEHGSLFMKCPKTGQGSAAMDIISTRSDIRPEFKGNKLQIRGNLKLTGYLAEYTCAGQRIEGHENIKRLEAYFTEKLNRRINTTVGSILQRSGADVLDIRDFFEKRKPDQWEAIEPDFGNLLKKAKVDIRTDVHIKLKGAGT